MKLSHTILIYILCFSLTGLVLVCCGLLWLQRRKVRVAQSVLFPKEAGTQHWKAGMTYFLQQSYQYCMRVAFLRTYVLKIRKRLSSIHAFDEFHLRKETMKTTFIVLGTLTAGSGLLFWINPDVSFLPVIFIAAIVINGLLIDTFVNRLERRLLTQMVDLVANVRHRYHQHGMVEEAIYEAADTSQFEITKHAYRIYEALTSVHPDEELEKYYETAPNRFLKAFAGISFMIMEFGDKLKSQGSIYLQGLSSLTKEIQLEILRRDKLDYLLKGLNVIALAPVFFTKPIERWARGNFPAMDDFYVSKLGLVTKMLIFVLIIVSYILLQKLQQYDETIYRAGRERKSWEQRAASWRLSRWLIKRIAPHPRTSAYFKIIMLLRDTNATLRYEWLYIRRAVLFIVCFSACFVTCIILHEHAKTQILYAPVKDEMLFGKMSPEQQQLAQTLSERDRTVMKKVHMSANASYEEVANVVKTNSEKLSNDAVIEQTNRVLGKLRQWNNEYFKWWELLISIIAGLIGYYIPLWLLYFQKKVRYMDMRHEVYQFNTVISMLREMERISVENILEWMNRFAIIFKTPIQKCLLHYEHGAEMALEEMKNEVTFTEFGRIVDKLLLAVDRIPISQAFDDLESEMAFYFEQRKQQYEQTINTKATLGRMIGFTPMYALIFCYLVIPLIGMSFTQMNEYYDQIQKI
ncbi:hypothetical protein PASE110613_00640 [Paenibacillus sediminis]|uniref:Type II secretion system protein GspF domain-containing protein n=1 Tax=Paenibacillus sediminis TaxID=664909 RepID=A0ABS4H060_9BACL|nr:hypothetical protein [Paenibacillus sediminis]MBP1935912.1 hypothetical protein [Paenibacillus sediminis]